MLEKDGEKARGIIEAEKIIEEREWKLVQYIEDIELIFNSYLDYPTDTFMERGIPFLCKSFSSRYVSLPSIDLIISLGIPDETKGNINEDVYAWIRAEYYSLGHRAGDKPKVSQAFMLGKHQLGVETDGMMDFLLTTNIAVDDHLKYIDEALRAVNPE